MLASMYKKVEVLDTSSPIKLSPLQDYKHTKNLSRATAFYQELQNICLYYPFYFAQDENGILPIVMLGINDKNVFVDENGKWKENIYIPSVCNTYPMGLSKDPSSDNYVLIYDGEYEGLNKKEGKDILKDGKLNEFGQSILDFLQEFQTNIIKTQNALNILVEYNLIKVVDIKITIDNKEQVIESIGIVDEEALRNLNDEQALNLVKKGIYRIIDMHLISLKNLSQIASTN